MFGLPKMPPQLSFHRDSWEEEPNLELEESWKQLLENPEVNTLPYPENCFENFYIDRLGCNKQPILHAGSTLSDFMCNDKPVRLMTIISYEWFYNFSFSIDVFVLGLCSVMEVDVLLLLPWSVL